MGTEPPSSGILEAWQEWQKVLMTLPDDSFFALAENYLGELQSPFHKPRIVKDLFEFLGRQEVRRRLKSLLDTRDLQVLSAVALLGRPLLEELLEFLGLGDGSLEVHHHLLNLEERLLIFRLREKGRVRMVLSPLWLEEGWAELLDQRLLFPSHRIQGAPNPRQPWFNDIFAAGLGSLVREKPHWFGPSGEIRKRHVPEVLKRFPGRNAENMSAGLKILWNLGLIIPRADHPVLNEDFWEDISRLPVKARMALFWTAGCLETPETAAEWSRHLWQVLDGWPRDHSLDRDALERWLGLAVGATGDSRVALWISHLLDLDVIQEHEGYLIPGRFPQEASAAPVKILPTAEFHLSPGMPLSVIWPMIRGASLKTWDVVTVFEINKTSVTLALGQGESASGMQARWESLQGCPVDRNLAFHLGEWEREYSLIRFYRGVVLKIHPSVVNLVESSPNFSSQVMETLAPGVYLIRSEGLEAWRSELHRRGLPMAPEPVEEDGRSISWGRPWSFSGWGLAEGTLVWPGGEYEASQSDKTYLDSLKDSLDDLGWSEESRQEAMARIHRRLVLDHTQLIKPWGRLEKAEARGLDFSGKIRIVEMALASGHDLLEIQTRDSEGQPAVKLVIPKSLERTGKDYFLKGELVKSQEPFSGYIGKMSLIKRIRTSLF